MSKPGVTDVRLRLLANGYDPVAVAGKRPVQPEWQSKINMTPTETAALEVQFPGARNTGINSERTSGLDVDIYDPDAAEAVYDAIKDWFGDRGEVTYRVGQAPKFLVPFRADVPFPKILREFRGPNGAMHRLEFLGKGQQFVADGVHPDIKQAYAWPTGHSLENTPRAALPAITEADAVKFMNYLSTLLTEQFAIEPVTPQGNGGAHGHGEQAWGTRDADGKIDVEASLAAIHDGGSCNAAQTHCIPSLLRRAIHPDDVLEEVVNATMQAAERNGLAWTRETEIQAVRKRILAGYNNVLLKDYDPTTGAIPVWLPGEFHTAWAERLSEARAPSFGFNRGGFYVRARQDGATAEGAPPPNDEPAKETAQKAKPGWSYYDSSEVKPQRWAVKQLLPETGVGIMSGQWGSFKTTAALDLSVAVMALPTFADQYRVKRNGAVLYFATEGAGTLQARLAAIARHRGAPSKLPFAWRGDCPLLTDKDAGRGIVKCVDEAAAHFEHTYGVPIVLIWIDTYITAAGLNSSGDDNDTAATQKAFNTLRFVAAQSGAFVAVIDHLGKVMEAGTRGSSGKEGNADTVLATLAEREITGAVSNSRMAARKQRDGISGFEVPFTPEIVEVGIDEDGDAITAVVLDWGKQQRERPKAPRKSKDRDLLARTLVTVTAKDGFAFQPDPGGATVQACHGAKLRDEFYKCRLAKGTPKQQADKRRAAFDRALQSALTAGLVGMRERNGGDVIWAK